MRLVGHGISEMSRLGKPLRWCRTVDRRCMQSAHRCCCGDARARPPAGKRATNSNVRSSAHVRDVVWSAGTPVRQALTTLGRTQGIAIMLDRRIDPGSGIELSVQDVTVRDVIEQLAAQCGAAPAYLDGVVYVGPRSHCVAIGEGGEGAARRSAAVAASAVAQRLAAARAWRWDDLAEPRNLLDELARKQA